jgi:hypothetical protein
MRLQSKISKSVRIGKRIVRLSLNPVLYSKSNRIVRWDRNSPGYIAPKEVILKAKLQYRQSSLSAAVESVLVDILEQHPIANTPLLIPKEEEEQLRRFSQLSLSKRIELTIKRNRLYRTLQRLPWSHDEERKGI